MAHARKQIRDAVKTALTGLAATGSNVFIGRARPFGEDEPACLVIYTPKETEQRAVYGQPPILERPLTLYVEGRVSSFSATDDDLDAIAEQVEPVLANAVPLGDLLLSLTLVATEIVTNPAAQGQRLIGGIRLEYRLTYRTREGAPSTIV